jgi:hypothetical protein
VARYTHLPCTPCYLAQQLWLCFLLRDVGFEPSEGTWDENYISTLSGIVDTLAKSGIYSLMDMHQDCMSMKFGMEYDGK